MTTDTRSPHEIEREIERDRAELTDNLESLQDKFSFDGMVRTVGHQLRENGSEIGATFSRTLKENPAAVALTGIGLAWMIFGDKSRSAHRSGSYRRSGSYDSDYDYTDHTRPRYDEPRRAVSRPDPAFKGGKSGLPSWAVTDDEDNESIGDRVSGAVSAAKDKASDAAQSITDKASATGSAVSSKVASATSAAGNAASKAASSAGDAAQAAKERAARLKARVAQGTEDLSQEARDRVIAARQAAIAARQKAAATVSQRAEQASDFYDQQPLVAGAIAVALGAAIGGALPRSQKEDELMGEHSDALMQEAERVFYEESEKAKAVVDAAKDEANSILREKKDALDNSAPGNKSATEAVADEAKSAGKRVADAAEAKAREKGLGKISS